MKKVFDLDAATRRELRAQHVAGELMNMVARLDHELLNETSLVEANLRVAEEVARRLGWGVTHDFDPASVQWYVDAARRLDGANLELTLLSVDGTWNQSPN